METLRKRPNILPQIGIFLLFKEFLRFYDKAHFLIRKVRKILLSNDSVFNFEIDNSRQTDSCAEYTPVTYFSITSSPNLNIFREAELSQMAPRH